MSQCCGVGDLSRPRAIVLALLAEPGFAVPALFGLVHAPASQGAGIMSGTLPIWPLLLAEIPSADAMVGILLVTAGVVVTVFSTNPRLPVRSQMPSGAV